jgi:hypothetical protein
MAGLEGVKLCSTRSDVTSEESVGVALGIGEDIIDIDSLELAVDGMAGRHIVLLFERCKLKNLVSAGDMMVFMLDNYVAYFWLLLFDLFSTIRPEAIAFGLHDPSRVIK